MCCACRFSWNCSSAQGWMPMWSHCAVVSGTARHAAGSCVNIDSARGGRMIVAIVGDIMKLIIAVALCVASTAFAADDTVRGYMRRDGAYVEPHHRTTPNETKMDNYSTQGNVNPYTGRVGRVDPDQQPSYGNHQPRQQDFNPSRSPSTGGAFDPSPPRRRGF